MRTLDKGCRMSVPSIREIHRGLSYEADRVFDELGITVQGSRRTGAPKGAHIMNWLACYLLTRPIAERNRILQEGRKIMDRHLESDTPVKFGLEVTDGGHSNDGEGAAHGRKKRGA